MSESSGRCATCRWWRTGDEFEDWGNIGALAVRDPATHERVKPQPFEIRYCESPKLRKYERPEQDGAATMDGSEYWSCLVTGPDFGCIHWAEGGASDERPKEDKEP